jgi:hypothetical protein
MEQLILGFLLRACHSASAKALFTAFPNSSLGPANSKLLESLDTRSEILHLIQSGEIQPALKLLNLHFPSFSDSSLFFTLHIQIMLEFLRLGNPMQALEYVQQTLLPLTVDSPARHQELSVIVGILAYEDISASPFATRYDAQRRVELGEAVAEELSKAFEPKQPGEEGKFLLESLIKHAYLVHKELGKKEEFICKELITEN